MSVVSKNPFSSSIAIAGLKSGDLGTIELAFQLAGYPPCKDCGFVNSHCRCNRMKEEKCKNTKI